MSSAATTAARDGTHDLLDTVWDSYCTRSHMADDYAAAIRYGLRVDWPRVNAEIIERWSESALVWIKREAWKRV